MKQLRSEVLGVIHLEFLGLDARYDNNFGLSSGYSYVKAILTTLLRERTKVERWLRLAGCKKIFPVSAYTGEGLDALIEFLADSEEELEAMRKR